MSRHFHSQLASWMISFILASNPSTSLAFGFNEHEAISNAALRLSLEIYNNSSQKNTDAIDALTQLLTNGRYGKIAACVDNYTSPDQMLSIIRMPNKESINNDIDNLANCKDNSFLAFMRSTHENRSHFQADLFSAARIWQQSSASIGHQSRDLKYALAVNAIASHYIQDSFAPGHITTPRYQLSDVNATAAHDMSNDMGAIFIPNSIAKSESDTIRDVIRSTKYDDSSDLERAIFTLADKEILSDSQVLFRGDSHLFRQDTDQQRLLLLTVQIKAIINTINSTFPDETEKLKLTSTEKRNFYDAVILNDTIQMHQWEFTHPTDANISYGKYDFSNAGRKLPLNTTSDNKEDQSVHTTSSVSLCSFSPCMDQLYPIGGASTVFSIDISREAQTNISSNSKTLITVSTPIFRSTHISSNFLGATNRAPTLGITWISQGTLRGTGGTLSYPLTYPDVETTITPYLRFINYRGPDGTAWKPAFGAKLDFGLTSYITFYLSAGEDFGLRRDNTLVRGPVLGAGITISAPVSQINSLLKP